MSCEVTVFLTGYPTRALHDALTRPVTDREDRALTRVSAQISGGAYTGTIYAARFPDVTMAELEAFFRSVPVGAYGLTQGIVMVTREQADPIVVNRLGWMPPVPEVSETVPVG